ncbi:MAG: hypothetical protein P0Y56_09745 [Candidatus Andeanibacterium colombiense]|uniref:Uncharacterized protein n=1 Tax=Candidatus Andeanibacterium colombiense TaxID=3121345 RepID=A0AAJ5X4C1_9SPHN|nr:MAG: hypothetical protein P0Y56_09745 [Sphingomonadaceae bacterium]
MIDYFAIALTHGLLALAAWRLLSRADLDSEESKSKGLAKPWLRNRRAPVQAAPESGPDA